MSKKVLLVGHCGPDSFALRSAIGRLGDVEIEMVNDAKTLEAGMPAAALLLVNRVLDGRFETGDGVELIERLASDSDGPAMMLISSYPEAQAQAEAAGALPGFGKTEMYDDRTAERIRAALGDQDAP